MKILIAIFLFIPIVFMGMADSHCTPSTAEKAVSARNATVVLLHGLARSSRSMEKLGRALQREGYTVINIDYPSTRAAIGSLSERIFTDLQPRIEGSNTVHYVTHSMGGILLRYHLETHPQPNLGRVVMLAPPSRGSEVADKLGGTFLYRWINGPAGNQLGTGTDSLPLRLKVPDFELGIIAGDRSINPVLSLLIPGPDDGKVALARVRPENFSDCVELHTTHATMMWNRHVIRETLYFLEHGTFTPRENSHE